MEALFVWMPTFFSLIMLALNVHFFLKTAGRRGEAKPDLLNQIDNFNSTALPEHPKQ